MQLLVIRHGHSQGDVLDVHEGWADLPLTEEGHGQARRMAKRVKEEMPPDVIFASTLSRARDVAKTLAEEVGCPIHFTDELKEMNNGHVAGMPMDDVRRMYPDMRGSHFRFEGGESKAELRVRVETFLHKMMTDYSKHDRIAIVSHGGTINALLQSILKIPLINDIWLATGDTGIHVIDFTELGTCVRMMNCTKHLEG